MNTLPQTQDLAIVICFVFQQLPFLGPHVELFYELIQDVAFWGKLLPLSIMILRFIHAVGLSTMISFISLSSILLYGCTPIFKPVYQLVDIFVVSTFVCVFSMKSQHMFIHRALYEHKVSLLRGKIEEWHLLYINLFLNIIFLQYKVLVNLCGSHFKHFMYSYFIFCIR